MFYRRFFTETFDNAGVLQSAALHYPPNFNYGYDVIDPLGELYPQKLCILTRDDHGLEARLTFGDLKRLSNQAANVFRGLGLSKGDVVMVSLRTHWEYWYLAIAAHKLGLILSPVFHLLSVEDFRYRMEKSGAKVFLTIREGETPAHAAQAAAQAGLSALYTLRGPLPGFADFSALVAAAPDTLDRVETDAREPILLYFTSGTTGAPKGVLHDHAFTLSSALAARYMQDVGPDSLHFATGNTAWEVVCGTKFYGHFLCESAIFVYDFERLDPQKLLAHLEAAKVTSMMAQPTVYRSLTDVGMDKYDLSTIHCYAVGGEKLMRDLAETVEAQTKHPLYEGYAQSEAGLIAANTKNMGRKEGSLGKILPKYHVELLRPDGSFAGPGEEGEVVIVSQDGTRPVGLLMGYFGEAESAEALWDGNLFHTGDLCLRDDQGFLYYKGRMDGLIKTKGYRVSPFEIENALGRHPAVYECLAVGEEDRALGQRIKALVHLAPGFAPTEELRRELLDFHNSGCTGYQKIRALEFVEAFPRNANGKIMREIWKGSGK